MFFWIDHNSVLHEITNVSGLANGSLHFDGQYNKSIVSFIERFESSDRDRDRWFSVGSIDDIMTAIEATANNNGFKDIKDIMNKAELFNDMFRIDTRGLIEQVFENL